MKVLANEELAKKKEILTFKMSKFHTRFIQGKKVVMISIFKDRNKTELDLFEEMVNREGAGKLKNAEAAQETQMLRNEMVKIHQSTSTSIDFKTLNTGIGVPAANTYTNVSRACSIQ
jgi:hypothetical protein